MAQLIVENLSHHFGPVEVLKNISFSLQQGEVISIVGPSGGGKTTLLHLCAGLLEVTEGNISNHFVDTAFAFQDARLLPWKNTLDNIAFGLKAKGVHQAIYYKKAREIAYRLGLVADDLTKFPNELSGGMRQRVAFARALVVQPQLLYLDEPFSALDIGLKKELQEILVDLVDTVDLSLFFITHDLMEAVRLSHRIILLAIHPGEIIHTFSLDEALSERDDFYVYQQTRELLNHPKTMQLFEVIAK